MEANRTLLEHALRGLDAQIAELQFLRKNYTNLLGGEPGRPPVAAQPARCPTPSQRKERVPGHCSNCGKTGHTRRTCTSLIGSSVSVEPAEAPAETVVTQ